MIRINLFIIVHILTICFAQGVSFASMPVKGKIVFSTGSELSIFSLEPKGKTEELKPTEIIKSLDQYRFPFWIPNGQRIIFSYGSFEDRKEKVLKGKYFYSLATVDPDGKNFQIFLKSDNSNYEYPSYSQNGDFLAFISYYTHRIENSKVDFIGKLVIYDIKLSKIIKIIDDVYSFQRPSWSFNDDIAFVTDDENIALYNVKSKNLKILNVKGESPIFHPDGKTIFFRGHNDRRTIFSVNIDGKKKTKIIQKGKYNWKDWESSSFDSLVKFSSDGRYIFLIGYGVVPIPPGLEYFTLEFLDLKTKKFWKFHDSGISGGASWYEPK